MTERSISVSGEGINFNENGVVLTLSTVVADVSPGHEGGFFLVTFRTTRTTWKSISVSVNIQVVSFVDGGSQSGGGIEVRESRVNDIISSKWWNSVFNDDLKKD